MISFEETSYVPLYAPVVCEIEHYITFSFHEPYIIINQARNRLFNELLKIDQINIIDTVYFGEA